MANPKLIMFGTTGAAEGFSPNPSLILGLGGPASCLAAEIRSPVAWYYDSHAKVLRELNLSNQSLTGRSVSLISPPVATLVDPFTANVWILSNALYVLTPTSASPVIVPLLRNGTPLILTNPSDLKLDFVQRKLWVVDAGEKRALQVGLDGTVTSIFSAPSGVTPAAVAINPLTGDAFIRCFNPNTHAETVITTSGTVISSSPDVFSRQPLPASIVVDPTAQRLLWISDAWLNYVDLKTMTSGSVFAGLDGRQVTLDVELGTDLVYLGGNANDGTVWLGVFDLQTQTQISGTPFIASPIGPLNALFVEQGHHDLLPGYFEVVAAAPAELTLPGSFEITPATFDVKAFENGPAIYDGPPSRDVYLPPVIDQKKAAVDLLVWGQSIEQLQSSGLTGLPNERWTLPETIRLPKFTWSTTSYIRNPGLLIGRNSDLERWSLPLKNGYLDEPIRTAIFSGAQQPAGAQPVNGVIAASDQPIAYATAGQWLLSFEIDSLSLLQAQLLPFYAQPTDALGWLTATKEGKVLQVTDPLVGFDVFDAPRKAVWSNYHQKVVVMSGHAVSILNPSNGQSAVIAASKTHWFGDIDVSENGELLVLSYPMKTGSSSARLLDPTFTRVLNEVVAEDKQFLQGRITGAGQFLAIGIPAAGYVPRPTPPIPPIVILSDSSSSSEAESTSSSTLNSSSSSSYRSRTLWAVTVLSNRRQVVASLPILGSLVNLSYEADSLFAVAITSEGDLVEIPALGQERGLRLVKNIGTGIVAASGGPHTVTATATPQSQVRVFVGSRPWQSDRWDSGIIATGKNAILYGGGDNLEPGMPYWVHVATYHADSGWAAPSIQRFLVPK